MSALVESEQSMRFVCWENRPVTVGRENGYIYEIWSFQIGGDEDSRWGPSNRLQLFRRRPDN